MMYNLLCTLRIVTVYREKVWGGGSISSFFREVTRKWRCVSKQHVETISLTAYAVYISPKLLTTRAAKSPIIHPG